MPSSPWSAFPHSSHFRPLILSSTTFHFLISLRVSYRESIGLINSFNLLTPVSSGTNQMVIENLLCLGIIHCKGRDENSPCPEEIQWQRLISKRRFQFSLASSLLKDVNYPGHWRSFEEECRNISSTEEVISLKNGDKVGSREQGQEMNGDLGQTGERCEVQGGRSTGGEEEIVMEKPH